MKKGVLFVFLALAFAILACLINVVSATDIGWCANITSSDTYVLNTSVSSEETCFNINVANVILDCNGFTINYSSSSTGYGVYSNLNNVTIKNCIIQQTSTQPDGHAIYFNGTDNGIIYNNTIYSSGSSCYGIYMSSGNNNNLSLNNITTSGASYGIYGTNSINSNILNNNITMLNALAFGDVCGIWVGGNNPYPYNFVISNNNVNVTSGWSGIHIHYLGNSIISNNSIIIYDGAGGGAISIYGSDTNNISNNNLTVLAGNTIRGINLNGNDNNIFSKNIINTFGWQNAGFFLSGSNNLVLDSIIQAFDAEDIKIDSGTNNFTNCTFNKSETSLSGTGQINVFWLADVYINDTNENEVSGVNVSIYDVNNILRNTQLTNSSGHITRVTLREYMQNATSSYFDTGYTFNASKEGYNSNWSIINLTTNFINPNPVWITLSGNSAITSLFGTNPVNNYITDSSSMAFDFKCSYNSTIETIQLWTNTTGTWHANYTNNSYTNNTWLNITVQGIPNGNYKWAVYCNESLGSSDWTNTNRTFTIDTGFYTVTECSNIISRGVYNLSQNLSSAGTCLNITAQNVTLDCNGFTINYSSSSAGYGIYTNLNNVTIKNCIIQQTSIQSNSHAIYFNGVSASNGTIFNNAIYTRGSSSHGIYLYSGRNNNLSLNNITTTGDYSGGIYLNSASNNTVKENIISATGTYDYYGFYSLSSTNNTLRNNRINTSTSQSYYVEGTTSSHYSNSIDTSNLAEGLPVFYNYSISNSVILQNVDLSSSVGQLICAWCNNVTYDNVTMGSEGINFYNTSNSKIINSNINATNGFGVFIAVSSVLNNISYNNITSSASYSLILNSGSNSEWQSSHNTVSYNNLLSTPLISYANNINLTNNNIDSGDRIWFMRTRYGHVKNNNITLRGAGEGIYLYAAEYNVMEDNNITATNSYGITFNSASNNNLTRLKIQTTSGYSIAFNSGDGNIVKDSFFDATSTSTLIGFGSSMSTKMINCTLNKSKIYFSPGSTSDLQVYFGAQVYVKDLDNLSIENANATIYNINSNYLNWSITDSSGYSSPYILYGYMQNVTGIFNISLYWFNVTKSTYYPEGSLESMNDSYYGTKVINVTLVTGNPVSLEYPSIEACNSSHSMIFIYTPLLSEDIKNATLWSNFSGSWRANNTNTSVVIDSSQNNITVNGIPSGRYIWNIQVCDVLDTCYFALANRTITIDDSAPTLELISPSDSEQLAKGITIPVYFQWSVSDNFDSDLACQVYTNDTYQETIHCENSTICQQNISGFSPGNYTWQVSCSDGANSIVSDTRNFSIVSAWFVSVEASPSGDGSIENPWNITNALKDNTNPSNENHDVQPGDTIYLREGIYRGHDTYFITNLHGTEENPITVMPYNKERVIIDAGINADYSYYSTYRDFEITRDYVYNTNNSRVYINGSPIITMNGVYMRGTGIKAINNIMHNLPSSGIYMHPNEEGNGTVVYGNIMYNNGWDGEDRGHNYGMYLKNQYYNPILISNNIVFNNLGGYGIHAYDEGYGDMRGVRDFDFENNVVFKNQFLIGAGVVDKIIVQGNIIGEGCSLMRIGYESENNTNAIFRNNVLRSPLLLGSWDNLTSGNNTIVGTTEVFLNYYDNFSEFVINNNSYYDVSDAPHVHGHDGTKLTNSFAEWQGYGYDVDGTYSSSNITGVYTYVTENVYDPDRFDIVVLNEDDLNSTDINMSDYLEISDDYEIRDAQNYHAVVLSGEYDGSMITLPLNLTDFSPLEGNFTGAYHNYTATHTSNAFNVFILKIVSEESASNNPVAYQGNPIEDYTSDLSSITLDIKCKDNVGVKSIKIYSDLTGTWESVYSNSSYKNNTWLNVTFEDIDDGEYAWQVYCDDFVGNTNNTVNRTLIVDASSDGGKKGGGGGGGGGSPQNATNVTNQTNMINNTINESDISKEVCGDKACSVTEKEKGECCQDCGCQSGEECTNNRCMMIESKGIKFPNWALFILLGILFVLILFIIYLISGKGRNNQDLMWLILNIGKEIDKKKVAVIDKKVKEKRFGYKENKKIGKYLLCILDVSHKKLKESNEERKIQELKDYVEEKKDLLHRVILLVDEYQKVLKKEELTVEDELIGVLMTEEAPIYKETKKNILSLISVMKHMESLKQSVS